MTSLFAEEQVILFILYQCYKIALLTLEFIYINKFIFSVILQPVQVMEILLDENKYLPAQRIPWLLVT